MLGGNAVPTPFPDVNEALELLLTNVRPLLAGRLIAVYLHGSLATGDFNCERSDVDFLVVTEGELPAMTLPALEGMHRRVAESGLKWASKLEGSYIPLRALRRYDPQDSTHPALRVDGGFGLDKHGSDWVIQRHLIREKGITLFGPSPDSLIDPVGPDDLRRAVRGILREWWSPPFPAPARFEDSEYRAYAVLTMCRALFTLQNGAVVSKPSAAGWARQTIGEPWAALIQQSLTWKPGEAIPEDQMFRFIAYTLGVAGISGRTGDLTTAIP